jgi:S1-C subfamily serine protease
LEPAPGVSPPPVEPLDFPDGLCIVAGEDALRVLTVLKGGRGEKSAFRGGDVLLEMAGQPVGTSLTGFSERYRKEREVAAKKREPLRFKIRRTSGETELLSLRIPPAWNSAFEE